MKRTFIFFTILALTATAAFAQKFDTYNEMRSPELSVSQITFVNGGTSVQFSQGFIGALSALQINVRRTSPVPIIRGTVSFPITGGTLDVPTLRGEILHSGGLILSRGGTSVKLQDFIIDTTGESIVLTGLVSVNNTVLARVPLFDLELPAGPEFYMVSPTRVNIGGVAVNLSETAAGALNAVFETDAFVPGFNIGTASVSGIAFGS